MGSVWQVEVVQRAEMQVLWAVTIVQGFSHPSRASRQKILHPMVPQEQL
jgi:hypothetical protein